jgi:hypothetical protein
MRFKYITDFINQYGFIRSGCDWDLQCAPLALRLHAARDKGEGTQARHETVII